MCGLHVSRLRDAEHDRSFFRKEDVSVDTSVQTNALNSRSLTNALLLFDFLTERCKFDASILLIQNEQTFFNFRVCGRETCLSIMC